jgi:hypothetical protein
MADSSLRLALERAGAAAGAFADSDGAGRALAVGYATVDLDRAAREVATDLVLPPAVIRDAAESVILGARCRLLEATTDVGLALVLLEPSTEGRIAAFLARFGEAFAVTWYATWGSDPTHAGMAGGASGRGPGPLGIERLVAGDPSHGPFRLVVADGRVPSTA